MAIGQDAMITAGSVMTVVAVGIITTIGQHNKGKKRILITDYRRGVHFKGDQFAAVLGPGSYRYDTNKERILIVDMRPQPVLIERFPYFDVLKRSALISISTELVVTDARLAATELKDQVKDSFAVLRNTLRDVVSLRDASLEKGEYPDAARAITAAVNTELGKVGMKVNPVEITESWVNPVAPVAVSPAR